MKRTEDPRCLLLEQLESRCMLAAGVLAHSSEVHDHQDRPSSDRDRPSDVRSHSSDSRSDARSDLDSRSEQGKKDQSKRQRDEGRGRRQDQNDVKPLPPPIAAGEQAFSQLVPSQFPGSQSGQPDNSLVDLFDQGVSSLPPPPASLPGNAFASDPPRSLPSAVDVPLGDRLAQAGVAEGEAVELVLETEDVTETAPSGDNGNREKAPGELRTEQGHSTAVMAAAAIEADAVRSGDGVENPVADGLDEVQEDTVLAESGLVDPSSITRRDLRPSLDVTNRVGEESEQWEVEAESLERLRDVARAAELPAESRFFRATDAVIASWFNHATGLIAVEAIGELQTPVDHVESVVDVVLDTAVGVRRSVDILAANSAGKEDDTGGVRDAVLAAFNAESMPVVSKVALQGRSVRYSAVSAPAVALLATGVTLVAKRSRRRVLMQATKQPGDEATR